MALMNNVSPPTLPVLPFVDLQAQRRRIGDAIDAAVQRVFAHGQFILGPEVRELEAALAARADARHCIACSSGTDALQMALMAHGIGRGDAVVVPSFTFVASAEAVVLAGAEPIFADIDSATYCMDSGSAARAIDLARRKGLRPAAIMAVDLFGMPADYDRLGELARAEGVLLIDDAAQSFGASLNDRPVGSLADITTTSFYPAKPLGCYGDGGALFTNDDEIAERLRSILIHGAGASRYEHERVGLNGRFDTIQAAILLQKLTIFDEEVALRSAVAEEYSRLLKDRVVTPPVSNRADPVWAQYTIRLAERDRVAGLLRQAGIPTAIYYPLPLHRQRPYRDYPSAGDGLPASSAAAGEVLSLPMHPYLDGESVSRVADALLTAL